MTLKTNPTTITLGEQFTNARATPAEGDLPPTPFTPDEKITGITIFFAPTTLDAAGVPVTPAPAAFGLSVAVPAADLAKVDPATGVLTFPIADLNTVLAPGVWAVVATETAGPNGTSAFSQPAFFQIAPPVLPVPVPPTVAVA